MSNRASTLADRFEQAVADLTKTIERCSDEQWRAICGEEKWSVAATVHHVAAQWPLEMEYITAAAEGSKMPGYSWDDINGGNEQHAKEFDKITKADANKALRDGVASVTKYVRGLSDEQLDRKSLLPLAGAEVSTQQLIEGGVLIEHATAHRASIEAAIEALRVS